MAIMNNKDLSPLFDDQQLKLKFQGKKSAKNKNSDRVKFQKNTAKIDSFENYSSPVGVSSKKIK